MTELKGFEGLWQVDEIFYGRVEDILHETGMIDYIELGLPFIEYDLYIYRTEHGHVTTVLGVRSDVEQKFISGIVTLPEYRNQGYGTKTVMAYAERENLDKILVNGYLDSSEKFFNKLPIEVEQV